MASAWEKKIISQLLRSLCFAFLPSFRCRLRRPGRRRGAGWRRRRRLSWCELGRGRGGSIRIRLGTRVWAMRASHRALLFDFGTSRCFLSLFKAWHKARRRFKITRRNYKKMPRTCLERPHAALNKFRFFAFFRGIS